MKTGILLSKECQSFSKALSPGTFLVLRYINVLSSHQKVLRDLISLKVREKYWHSRRRHGMDSKIH